MSIAAINVDLPAAALAEYQRRRTGWIKMRDRAASQAERSVIIAKANADLLIWQDIVNYLTVGRTPQDSRPMAQSARKTQMHARKGDRATNEQLLNLFALARHLEMHALCRHRTLAMPAERKAA